MPPDHPALGVWREAAWCHLLSARGFFSAVVARLRVVSRAVTGAVSLGPALPPAGEAEAISAAADLFAQLRAAVSADHPAAFSRLPAA
ncbi:MAG TPA: hypothetical protein VKE74_19270 [Gemmataceae bacterium]|nr:hypothetical protein [Gemmataceae bacterium]